MKDITFKEEDKIIEEQKDDANTFEEDLNKLKLLKKQFNTTLFLLKTLFL